MNRVWKWIGRRPMGGDAPGMVAPPQPRPLETRVSRMRVSGRWVTSIWRAWKFDDVKDCRLCLPGRCSAVGGSCLFTVSEDIPDARAPLYQIGRTPRQGAG